MANGKKTALTDGQERKMFFLYGYAIFSALTGIYLVGSFFPDSFLWGVHQLAFFDGVTRVFLFTITLAIPWVLVRLAGLLEKTISALSSQKWMAIIVALAAGVAGVLVFHHFSIAIDMYGDTTKIIDTAKSKNWGLSDILNLKETEPITYIIHTSVASLAKVDLKTAFLSVSIGSGALFLVLLVLFASFLESTHTLKIFFVFLFLTAGANLNFFGHAEDYSVAYVVNFALLFLAYQLFAGKEVLLPIAIGVSVTILICAWAYVFYFHAFRFETSTFEERAGKLFLPLVNPLPPPHNYTLLSLNHLSDVVQEVLFTTSPMAIFIFGVAIVYWKKISWSEPRLIFFILASFYFLAFNLTITPIQSMPRDWDFLSLASVPVNFMAVALASQLFHALPDSYIQRLLVGLALAPALLSTTTFYLNAQAEKVGERLVNIGVWTYKSYYHGSIYMVNVGLRILSDVDKRIAKREDVIRKLLPYKSLNDGQLGSLYETLGYDYYQQKDYEHSYQSFSNALKEDDENTRPMILMANTALLTNRIEEASDLLSSYNETENDPDITNWRGLMTAEFAHSLLYLKEQGNVTAIRNDILQFEPDAYNYGVEYLKEGYLNIGK